MKVAVIFSVPMKTSSGFCWRWRSDDGNDSKESFTFYYDCLANARENGYVVKPTPAHGHTAPDHGAVGA